MPRLASPLRLSLVLMLLLLAGPAPAQQARKPANLPASQDLDHDHDHDDHHHHDGTYRGRVIAEVMSYLGANWLMRPTRVQEERPDEMLDSLKIEPGMTVADVGAGVGYHALKMAERVGPDGLVYATDVQPQMLRMLNQRARRAQISNVKPVLVTQDDPGLPTGEVDLILMVDVYHEVSNPEATLRGLRAALKPGGRLVLVEFRAEDPNVPIKPEHKMTIAQARAEVEPNGFRFKEVLDFLPWQHIIIFEKQEDVADADLPTAEPAAAEPEADPTP